MAHDITTMPIRNLRGVWARSLRSLHSACLGTNAKQLLRRECLRADGIETVGELMLYSREELKLLGLFGEESMRRIEAALHEYGLELPQRDTPDGIDWKWLRENPNPQVLSLAEESS